jgi:hypothetical protein
VFHARFTVVNWFCFNRIVKHDERIKLDECCMMKLFSGRISDSNSMETVGQFMVSVAGVGGGMAISRIACGRVIGGRATNTSWDLLDPVLCLQADCRSN